MLLTRDDYKTNFTSLLKRLALTTYSRADRSSDRSSVQFKIVSMRSGKPICAPLRLLGVSPTLPLKQFQCWSD